MIFCSVFGITIAVHLSVGFLDLRFLKMKLVFTSVVPEAGSDEGPLGFISKVTEMIALKRGSCPKPSVFWTVFSDAGILMLDSDDEDESQDDDDSEDGEYGDDAEQAEDEEENEYEEAT